MARTRTRTPHTRKKFKTRERSLPAHEYLDSVTCSTLLLTCSSLARTQICALHPPPPPLSFSLFLSIYIITHTLSLSSYLSIFLIYLKKGAGERGWGIYIHVPTLTITWPMEYSLLRLAASAHSLSHRAPGTTNFKKRTFLGNYWYLIRKKALWKQEVNSNADG